MCSLYLLPPPAALGKVGDMRGSGGEPPAPPTSPGAPDDGTRLPSLSLAGGWAGSPPVCPGPCGRTRWLTQLQETGQDGNRTVGTREHLSGARAGQPVLVWGTRARDGADPPPRATLPGPPLTLGLQLGEDGLGPADGSRCEGLHALLGRVAHRPHVRVAVLGGAVGRRHHVAGGADEGQAGHAVHHAGLHRGSGSGGLGPKPGVSRGFNRAPTRLTLVSHPRGGTSRELGASAGRFPYVTPNRARDTHCVAGVTQPRTAPGWNPGSNTGVRRLRPPSV